MKRTRRGLTLVEVLIVMGVLVLLVGLLLPGVQLARGSARRVECRNSLKQLGLAIHNYHETFNTIPPGWISSNSFGWYTFIIPQIDSNPYYNRLDFNSSWQLDNRTPQTIFPICRCPEDPGSVTIGPPEFPVFAGRSNYAAVSGATLITNKTVVATETHGPFGENSKRNFRVFTDGLAYTFLVGERKSSGGFPPNSGGDGIWVGVRNNDTQQGQAFAIGDCNSGNLPNAQGANASPVSGFSSYHAGGVQFLIADGSVRFISDKIESSTYANLSTIDDGNKLGEF
jgi:type II secretory pathway pseudopilin PulG